MAWYHAHIPIRISGTHSWKISEIHTELPSFSKQIQAPGMAAHTVQKENPVIIPKVYKEIRQSQERNQHFEDSVILWFALGVFGQLGMPKQAG
ncbi:MAG: hypothetical protein Tsb009_19650 [Planctomycetaceae bacterium]